MLALPRNTLLSLLKTRCPNCLKQKNYATRKRFYRNTGIVQNENKWEITLDHRRLKTPNGKVFSVPSEQLARAIAAEWDTQIETITQPTMHLTSLCNTAMDNPGKCTPHDIVNFLLEYLPTDTLLFFSDEEVELRALQEKKWTPIIEWFQKRFNVTQEVSRDLQPPAVNIETRAILARHFLSYDFTALNAISFGVEALKSPLLMLACMERRLEPHEAVMLARLEEEYQLARWGRVPWAHELNQADLTSRVAASILVIHTSADRHSAKSKAKPSETTAPFT
ncbi:ATP synthase mitochondrial F1 complex assembly factor 2 [Pectinophora gossypiella]|nr:ATP synthase mitochondrial F1 complex assembly factor 2 [Pectinophora gossypiella]